MIQQPVKVPRSKGTNSALQPVAAGPPQLLSPFANIVKQTQPRQPSARMPIPQLGASIPPLCLQPQGLSPASSGVPGRPTSMGTVPITGDTSASKSPGVVARRLFPADSKNASNPVNTMAKNTITYSKPSMAKTKVVAATTSTMSQPLFSSKAETVVSESGGRLAPKGLLQAKMNMDVVNNAQADLQRALGVPPMYALQPIMSTSIQTHPVSSMPIATTVATSAPPPEYSPFNNLFSQVAESLAVLGAKKEEIRQEQNRPNFAAVAAIGVNQPPGLPMTSASPGPPHTHPQDEAIDPSLPSKAPGYKAPGAQRTASPHIHDMSKAPGFKAQFTHPPPPLNKHIDYMDVNQVPPFMHGITVATSANTFDPSKAPGYKAPQQMNMAQFMEQIEREKYRMSMGPNQLSLSPRSAGSSGGQSPRPLVDFGHHGARDEYSTPNQPMTLPKIESTLNPNAPDFTSRTAVAFLHHQLLSLQQHAGMQPQGFGPMRPSLNHANNAPPLRVPPHGPMGQPFSNNPIMAAPNPGFVMPPNVNIPELMGNLFNSAMMAGSASGSMGPGGMPPQVPPMHQVRSFNPMQQGPAAPGSLTQSLGSSSQGKERANKVINMLQVIKKRHLYRHYLLVPV
jgi:hypothetical protein